MKCKKQTLLTIILMGIILTSFSYLINTLPTEKSTLFSGSGNCKLCHSSSVGVLSSSSGRDVSPLYHWQSSMMGNSAKDPYWQAKVSSEVEENPHLQEIIEDKCATCHAPMGRTEAIYHGQTHYTFNDLKQDPLSLDGVSCTVCHQIDPDNLSSAESFSGNYVIKPSKIIYGPYENPFTISMVNNTGYTPAYSAHIESSALCATCHTLVTPYVDQDGNVAGYFPEQMPYYEWLNSSYPDQEMSCQKCHMPRVNEEMKIASIPANLQNVRNPIFEHHFVGGNTVINRILKENHTNLGISSGTDNLDTTLQYTLKNLKEQSLALSANLTYENNIVFIDVTLKNNTGHKIPTGFPSRRMWIHLTVTDDHEEIIFESGKYDENGIILSQENFEFHHDTISSAQQVQIYEAVLGNTQNEVTTILLEAAQYLKDNRIPPMGFVNNQSYDSLIAITGKAADDVNFNMTNEGSQGSGSDQVTYSFSFTGDRLKYIIEICYQPIKPNYSDHISTSSTDESELFTQMYADAEKVEIISTLQGNMFPANMTKYEASDWEIYPNPTHGNLYLEGIADWPVSYYLYSLNGELAESGESLNGSISFKNCVKGIYILRVESGQQEKSFSIVYQ